MKACELQRWVTKQENSLLEFNNIKQIWLDKHLARFDLWLALQTEIAEVERNYITHLDQE